MTGTAPSSRSGPTAGPPSPTGAHGGFIFTQSERPDPLAALAKYRGPLAEQEPVPQRLFSGRAAIHAASRGGKWILIQRRYLNLPRGPDMGVAK